MDESFHVLWDDGERVLCRGSRLRASGERRAVLIMLPAEERPSSATLDRLAHHYELRGELDGAWAAQPLELVSERGRTMLLLEDSGGELLAPLLGAPMELGSFLRLAIGIAAALCKTHQRGLVHKDLKPGHILVNCADGAVRLTGFGIASRLPRERQALEPPETLAGTLAYMSPEQTGRMNRSIDSRSDLYSLGVTFYQMLTGSLPFAATDAMEWVHCHIARRPARPSERLETVPLPVCRIVMKLLAKTAEERYQTAAGLGRDLQRCLADWEACGGIDDFPLGRDDTPDRLVIPEKLYGRAREVESLLASFDRIVKSGAPELVLVSGYSGIGKSSVVNELHKALVPPRGLFASGKFDQYKRDIPYSTLVQAFQSLVRPLLGNSDAELGSWRSAFLKALEPNAQLITDLIPELKLVIGDQPLVPELEPQQAQSRFQLVFRRFIGVFARPEHPLALFLDDLQWLDAATLDLMEDLLTRSDLEHLMLIGAYRDNEVDAMHPLMRKLEAIKAAGGKIEAIMLAPLTPRHLGELIADAVHSEPERAAPLAQLVHEKTAGNAFFAIQFLHALAEERLLHFDYDAACWSWDLHRIHAKGYADNVVDLMIGKLTRLPLETQEALQRLACLGNVVELAMIAIVLQMSEEQVRAVLWPAVREELIERLEASYTFSHDRVQEAAYSMIPADARAEAHLLIGRSLTAQTPPEKQDETIFEIVGQLNRGAALITGREERDQLAELNLIAGRRAKGSAAYASALAYFKAGVALLSGDSWERQHELTFALELNRAECEFLTGLLAVADERLAALSNRATTNVEHASVACLRMDVCTTLDQSGRAVDVGLHYLRYVGIDWSPHPKEEEARHEYRRIWSLLGGRTIEDLIDLPLMEDPASIATADVLNKVWPPAFFTDANLAALTICKAVSLSLERGNYGVSCFAYVMLCNVAGPRFGDYKAGFRFGQLGYELVERRGLKRFEVSTYHCFAVFVLPWMKHVRACPDLLRRNFEAANRIGDLMYGAYDCLDLNSDLLFAGEPLPEVQGEAEHGLAFAERARFGLVIDVITTQLALIRTLRGLTPTFGCFDDGQFNSLRTESHLSRNPALALAACWYWIRKLQARYLAGDYATAMAAASEARPLLWTTSQIIEEAEYHFYGALAQAVWCDSAPAGERQQHLAALAAHHRQLRVWAENCAENFENRAALVGAEIARLEARNDDAMRLYEEAIRSARANGFVHNEAIAYERASAYYRARGFDQFADFYLRNSRYCYLRWGADGKVRQLDELFPHLRVEEPMPGATSTIAAPVERLDLATVIKVSQAVSGEMVLDKLIGTLMRTAVEQAGAERGLLILSRGAEPRIEAEATTSGDMVSVQLRDERVTAGAAPETVLHYVMHGRETIILDNAATDPSYASDPYIRQRQLRSVLCLPLINQAKLIGALYLENNLTVRAFAPARIAVLKLLASQAAISLENTRLYRNLEQRDAKIRGLFDANIIGICVGERDGRMIEANDAYLRILGYDREDLLSGRISWTDLTPPEWRDPSAQAFSALSAAGVLSPFEKEYIRKDGSRVPVLLGAALIEGTEHQTVAFVLDLTERKRAEEALRRSEAYLAEAQKLSHTGSWARNVNGETTHSSEEHSRLFGFDPELGVPSFEAFAERIHAEDRATVAETFLGAIAERTDFETAFRIALPDGTIKYIRGVGHPVFDSAGELVEYVGTAVDVTERKRAEQALREREAKIRRLVDANIIGIFIWDFEGRILESNDAFLRMIGYDREDLASGRLRWTELTPPEWEERDAALAQQQRMSGSLQPFEKEYLRKDGVRVPVLIGTAIFEERGDQGVAFVLDLTERKRAEQALRRSEAALAEGQRLTHTGTWIYDPAAEKALYWSEEQFRIHGLDPQKDMPDQEVLRRQVHPDDRGRVFARFVKAIREKLEIEEDFRIVLTDGTAKHLHVVGHPVVNGAGELVEYIGTAVDVTERRCAEQALRDSEEQWKAVFENNPTMYFMVDASGAIMSVNPFGAEQLGFTAAELVGLPVRDLFHAADRETIERNTAVCFERRGQTMSWEARKIRKNGEMLWVRETARVMLIKDRPVALIVCEDITERKRVNETLRDMQTQLAHANRVATMGQLTASIAHEVNQPIAAAVTNAHAALRWLKAPRPDLEEVGQAVGRIVANGSRAGHVISRIRALIKKAPPRKEGVAINDAILEVVALTHGEAVKNGVSVRTQLAEALPSIEGDRVQLQQVILNLIVNAIEAMSGANEAPRDLLLSTEEVEPEGVKVTVRDSGPGLSAAALERLFEAFYTTKPNGLGLGLSICRSIVEAHGGRLWATANEPHGAAFHFTAPARPAQP